LNIHSMVYKIAHFILLIRLKISGQIKGRIAIKI
jgi:hypothetical protein